MAMVMGGLMPARGKVVHLLPSPQLLVKHDRAPFLLGKKVKLEDPTHNVALLRFLNESGCVVRKRSARKVIVRLVPFVEGAYDYELHGFPAEGYKLRVTSDSVSIEAVTSLGVTRAAQTLTQLAEGYAGKPALEAIEVTDWPAFKWRGWMHDVGRSFISLQELERQIDLLARFKVNVFHWHLTENQAWRFEVKAYPQLTSAGSMTRFLGKYYTQDDCRRLVKYAADRGVVVVPEIDMPGHSAAFKRAMGYSMQTRQGVESLKAILEEVADVFASSPYIHIGADEEAITYPDFLKIMTDKVHALGKRVIAWNPVYGIRISKDTGFDLTHLWSAAGKKVAGIPNIDSRYNYTNHFDVFADLIGIYKSNIYYQAKGSPEVAGFITAPWNDRKLPHELDIVRQNNLYANTLASVERAWKGGGNQYIEEGGVMLPLSGNEYEGFADWERRFLFHKAHSLRNEPIPYVKQTHIRWRITEAFPNEGDSNAVFPPESSKDTAYVYRGRHYATGIARGAGIYLRHTWGKLIPAYYANPQLNTTAYAWTYVYSPVEQQAGAVVEFQNYSRSERDLAPDKGKWDRKGSRIWLNGTELLPPLWENSGKAIGPETELLNENFTARLPLPVVLKRGWNEVFLKLPYVKAEGIRLNKWMFTFVLTDLEGKNALEDVYYSSERSLPGTRK